MSDNGRCDNTAFSWKLWIYTNFDCNLRCSYCVAESGPDVPRRGLSLAQVRRIVDEAVELGFPEVFLTGGEPFILDEIYDMLAYSSARHKTTVLTNAMLLKGARLEKLRAVANDNLVVQVSLDGGRPEHHDAYRGEGPWAKTVVGIKNLRSAGLRVRISSTETSANRGHMEELRAFCRELGISDADHLVRPLARRGFSTEGLEVGQENLVPELTVTVDGIYWHPLASPSSRDMLVSGDIFPLATAVDQVQSQLAEVLQNAKEPLITFT
jgi:MoaA/NifB/PqqE/SkfB family radical SAM enzyme